MMANLKGVRGAPDILPQKSSRWQRIENVARAALRRYGYAEIRTPVFERTEVFIRGIGEGTDIVEKEMYTFTDQGQESLTLRPEATAPVVRAYLEHQMAAQSALVKVYYLGPMFRRERPQSGRYRQFHQIGVEAIGPNSASPYLDAEILALAMHLLNDFGVKGAKLKINSLGSKEDKEVISSLFRKEFSKHKKDLCEDCQSRFERNVFRVLDCKNESCRKVVNAAMGSDVHLPLSVGSLQYFNNVQSMLKDLGIRHEVSRHLVRGLDYYTHTVFEITAEGLGSQDAVGAGGRYSGLIHELGGDPKTDYGAVGFALGIERILLASGATQPAPSTIDAFVIAMDEVGQKQAFKLVNDLRHVGISADMNYNGGKIGSQMNRANKLNARFALILGEEEMKSCSIAVKNMTNGAQENVALKDVLEYLRNTF